ncbi:MAG: hypothetical protein R2877_03025 [Bdellovibrionota bacterium]
MLARSTSASMGDQKLLKYGCGIHRLWVQGKQTIQHRFVLVASPRPDVKGELRRFCNASFAAFSTPATPPRTIKSASDALVFGVVFDFPQSCDHFALSAGLFTAQSLRSKGKAHRWRRQHVRAAIRGSRCPCCANKF